LSDTTRIRLRLLLTLAAVAIGATMVSGFTFSGPTWPDGFIEMQLQLGSNVFALSDEWLRSAFVVEAALATWNTVIQRTRFTVVEGPRRQSAMPTR
jgi:hypothetical protein